jgi:hypothetical protein
MMILRFAAKVLQITVFIYSQCAVIYLMIDQQGRKSLPITYVKYGSGKRIGYKPDGE